jgi:hypothetical protein
MPTRLSRLHDHGCPGLHNGSTSANRGVRNSTAFLAEAAQNACMLFTIVAILVVLWLLGMVTAYTMGGLLHILLVIAVIVVLLRVIQGRSPLRG